jgi:hypothetical protein
MILGRSAYAGPVLRRVVQIWISRDTWLLPRRGEPFTFLVALHDEGTATT